MIDEEFKIPDLPEGQMDIEPHLLERTEGLEPVTRPARSMGATASERRARQTLYLNGHRPYVFYRR